MIDSVTFVAELSRIQLPSVFNPYSDQCVEHDHLMSAAVRRANLAHYLNAALSSGVDSLWLGRDCGYRGGRRTGIALTDEIQLPTLERHFAFSGLTKATVGESVKERTATEVWKLLAELGTKVFLWNVFPFHPFEEGNSMSNRRHTAQEFKLCKHLLVTLIELLKPRRIIALGNDAHREVAQLGISVTQVRHPSYGGHIEFRMSMRRLYNASK